MRSERRSDCKYTALTPLSLVASFAGTEVISGVEANHWVAEGQYTNNYASTVDGGDEPVQFWEHKGELLKQWEFVLESYVAGPPGDGLFEIPEECKHARFCHTLSTK